MDETKHLETDELDFLFQGINTNNLDPPIEIPQTLLMDTHEISLNR